MKWFTGESGVLLKNCGPMFDLTVTLDGPRISVVASTGVGMSGGLSLQRSAVNVRHDASMDNLLDVTRMCAAGDVVILSFPGYSRVCQFQTTPTLAIKELFESPFDESKETLTLVYDPERDTFVQVTTAGVYVVKGGGHGAYTIRNDELGVHHANANAHLGLLVFSSSRCVSVVDLKTLLSKVSIELENEVACLMITSSYSFAIGEWNSGAVCLYEFHGGEVVLKGRILCSATACSMCILSHLHASRLVVGLLNGCIADIHLEAMTMEGVAQETLIRMQPVQLFNLEGHNAVLCLGEVPLIVFLCDTGFQLTGIDFNDVAVCAVIDNPHVASKYMFFSRSENTLVFGNIVDIKKLNSRFLGLNATVTRVKYIAWWNVFVLAVRHNEKDQMLLLMEHELAIAWVPQKDPVAIELLENERCVFIEPVVLGGANESATYTARDGDKTLLLGTTFAFPDEQLPRSSRFIWYSVEEGQLISERPQLRQLGSKDVEGALQCCCIVPNYSGRIALGINGCVALYSWNAVDSIFVAEETVSVGTIVTRLQPIFQPDTSYLVAFDARQSCFFIQIDIIQGSLKIVARDTEPRGVMDGVVLDSAKTHDICFGDDYYNFYCLSHGALPSPSSPGAASVAVTRGKLKTKAQYHLGDMVTAMQLGSFAPCLLENTAVPVHSTLIPGILGPQIVFGTSHGAFGTITPVSNETYLLLKALEVAVASVVPALGGFEHATYREVLCAGQERGYSRNASFENANPVSQEVFRQRRKRYLSRCVCSGDLIESFLTLPRATQQRVVREADQCIRGCFASMKSTLEEFFEHSDVDKQSAGESDVHLKECTAADGVNALFFEKGLPTLPLTREAVNDLLQKMQRIY
ncbi:damage-specific DNA binding protein [Trypanosoma rangeli SC58]|uniref:Damage-specific DNA binding protein n=1 Tax=Trypanosoma rangeli SC58 TaxID=429131 RepID=A0A061J905_TRYRA|nr:damage-specific DNA binding protein [Trypanosoma rangeli SC58]